MSDPNHWVPTEHYVRRFCAVYEKVEYPRDNSLQWNSGSEGRVVLKKYEQDDSQTAVSLVNSLRGRSADVGVDLDADSQIDVDHEQMLLKRTHAFLEPDV